MPTYVVTGPDGKKYRVTAPSGASEQEVMDRVRNPPKAPGTRPTSFWQGVAEGIHPVARNIERIASFNPLDAALDYAASAAGLPTSKDVRARKEQSFKKKQAQSPYQGSTAGKITGSVLATAPTAFIPGGPVVQGAAAGGLMNETGNAGDILRDMLLGGVGGKVGQVVGSRVVAPVARKTADVVRRAAGKAVPALSTSEKAVARIAPEIANVRANVAEAAEMGLPYSLADADARLRSLAGSVARKSTEGRALAEKTFAPRARAQADRATQAVEKYLTPPADVGRRGDVLLKLGSRASRPLYEKAFSQAAPIDEATAGILQRPAGKSALRKAFTIAQNEGRDPLAMGFDLDDAGEVILRENPSFETLDLVKRGIDSELEQFRNPVTGVLQLRGNPMAQSIETARKSLVGQLDKLNKAYPEARSAYAGFAARKGALEQGVKGAAPNVKLSDVQRATGRLGEATLPEYKTGYASGLADIIEGRRLSGNPYEAIYGTPRQQAKLSELFPEGAEQFRRQAELEADMAKTAWETLGGSPTQTRAMADQLFDTNIAGYGQAALETALSPKLAAVNALRQRLSDTLRTRGESKAAEMAPALYETNPQTVLEYLDQMMRNQAAMEARKRLFAQGAGSALAPIGAVLGPAGSQ